MCVCYRPPVLGVYPNYEVVEFQPTTVIPPEPRLCCFWLRIYSFTAPPSLPVLQCPQQGVIPLPPQHPPPHLGVFVASRRPPMPDDMPFWHVHSPQVTAGQRLCHLLDNCHLGSEVAVHEMFAESSCAVRYHRAPWNRTLHLL